MVTDGGQFFAVFGSSGSSGGGGGGLSGSGTANFVAKWSGTSSLTNSIIQDNGSEASIGSTPDTGNGFRVFTANTEIWSSSILAYTEDGRTATNYNTISGISVNSNSGTNNEVGVLGQVHPASFQNTVHYAGVKGQLGGVNVSDHNGVHTGVLGSADQSGKDLIGVAGTIRNGKSCSGVKGFLLNSTIATCINFTGVTGEAIIDDTTVSGFAIGVQGKVTLENVSNLPTNPVGGQFGGTFSIGSDAGTYSMIGLLAQGITTTSAGGILQNAYALKIEANTETFGTITNKWGVYQEGANDLNYFLAPTGMGGLPIPNAMLKVSKDTVSTQETFGIQVSNSSSNSNAGANGTNYGIYSNTQNQGTGSAVGIYSSINNGEADNFNIQAVSTFTKNTGTAVGISHGSTVNNDGGTTTVTRLREFEILSSTGSGTVTNHYSLYSGGAGITNTENAFHIYLNGHAQGTLKYGIYQEGASDLNYFNASTGIGVDPKDSEAKFTSVSLLTSDANDNYPVMPMFVMEE